MKKILFFAIYFICCKAIFAQDYKNQGREKAAEGDFSGAAAMYQLCMEHDEECTILFFELIYEKKIEREYPNQLYRIVSPLAQKGNPIAQFYLASMYYNGYGIEKNLKTAARWFTKSAMQGNTDAQNSLGYMYEKGIGFSKNRTKAKEWYRKAAELGNEDAKNNLKRVEATYLRKDN